MNPAEAHWKRLHEFRDRMTGGVWSAETYRLILGLTGVIALVVGFIGGWCLAVLALS